MGIILSIFVSVSRLLGGPPWPVDPEIHFRDTNDGSSLRLPFEIINKSGFQMPSVSFRCGVQSVRATDAVGHSIFVGGVAFFNGVKTVSTTATFDCDAADLLKIKSGGSLALRNSATELEQRGNVVYQLPWNIVKMCIWVGGKYNFMGFWPVEFTSHMFQWPAKPGSHQWREGPFIGDRPPDEMDEEKRLGLIPGIYACPDNRSFPYIFVDGPARALLIFDPKDLIIPLGPPPWP